MLNAKSHFWTTLRHFGRYQQFSDAVYGVYINVFKQVQKPYRLRVIQTLISPRSAGSDSSVGLRACINDTSRQIVRRFESGREPLFSRFPRPNPVARRVFQFYHEVGVELHAPFCWECWKAYLHFSAVRKMRLCLRLTLVCTPSLSRKRFQTFLVWHDLDMSS